jgi:hypothetical protein
MPLEDSTLRTVEYYVPCYSDVKSAGETLARLDLQASVLLRKKAIERGPDLTGPRDCEPRINKPN